MDQNQEGAKEIQVRMKIIENLKMTFLNVIGTIGLVLFLDFASKGRLY